MATFSPLHERLRDHAVDLGALLDAVDTTSRLVGYQVGGHSARWLARRKFPQAV